jgi:hypothetical protein
MTDIKSNPIVRMHFHNATHEIQMSLQELDETFRTLLGDGCDAVIFDKIALFSAQLQLCRANAKELVRLVGPVADHINRKLDKSYNDYKHMLTSGAVVDCNSAGEGASCSVCGRAARTISGVTGI